MKTTHCSWLVPGCLSLFLLASGASRAWAVSVHTRSHAHDSVGAVTQNDDRSGAFGARTESVSTVQGAHGHSWASATVGWFQIDKSVGGHGWTMDGNSPKHWSWSARSSTGKFLLIGPNSAAPVRIRIPGTGTVPPTGPPNESASPIGPTPSQGMFVDSFFDVFFDVDVSLTQGKVREQVLKGSAQLGGPSSATPGLLATGDLANRFNIQTGVSPAGKPRFQASLTDDVLSEPVTLRTNMLFDSFFDVFTEIGRDDGSVDPPLWTIPPGEILGGAASYSVRLEVLDTTTRLQPIEAGDLDLDGDVDIFDVSTLQVNYQKTTGMTWTDGDFDEDGDVDIFDVSLMQPNYGFGVASAPAPVPEPSTCVLGAMGLAALLLTVARRSGRARLS